MMLLGRKIHPRNFEYASYMQGHPQGLTLMGRSFTAELRFYESTAGCWKIQISNNHVTQPNCSDSLSASFQLLLPTPTNDPPTLSYAQFCGSFATLVCRASSFELNTDQQIIKTNIEGIGFHGESIIINFDVSKALGFYGLGERTKRFNKCGDSLEQWTVDVVATFRHTHDRDDYDPTYVVIPWTIIRFADSYVGIYFDNPGWAMIDIEAIKTGQLIYQSRVGATNLYFIMGKTLREVVSHFTELVGRAEIPPLWSLGYHQCRWGYKNQAEFVELQQQFATHDIPVSAFWYDIDYMDGYRLFTWNPTAFPDPAAFNHMLKQHGIYTVAIVDPGVKLETSYSVYKRGHQQDVFCKTLTGKEFVGRVWPGDVVFPDFTLPTTQQWWANELAQFLSSSQLDGAWLDMNDPATGFSDYEAMRFQRGQLPHERYHNQYGHFMAKASYQAFLQRDSQQRPFLLTRSGFTGTQRYSAIWTGDNVSNWAHLRMSIPCTLNLGLSGVAFNGPDIGGFMGHTNAELLIRWYQTGFLFPFFRNHTVRHSKNQEPWQFGDECLQIIRATIKTRYRLLPYLYQCFSQHYWTGDPVLRPLMYHYHDPEYVDLDDQFLVGEHILVAPILCAAGTGHDIVRNGRKYQQRFVTLPDGWWFDVNQDKWLAGKQTISYLAALDEVPLFIRDGSIIPYYNEPLHNSLMDLRNIELHVFIKERAAQLHYFIDDPQNKAYQKGTYNTATITAQLVSADCHLDVANTLQLTMEETGPLPHQANHFKPVLYGYPHSAMAVVMQNNPPISLQATQRTWLNKTLSVLTTPDMPG